MATADTGKKQLSIHKIREVPLEYINIETNYDVIREIGSGDYGKVILASHKSSHFEVKKIILFLNNKLTQSESYTSNHHKPKMLKRSN